MRCQAVCPFPLLLVCLPFVVGLALSPLLLSAALHRQVVHPLPPTLGEQPHAAVALRASLLHGIAELLQPGQQAVEALGVGSQRVGGGGLDEVLKGQVAEELEAEVDRLGLDRLDRRQAGDRGSRTGGGVAAPLLVVLLLADGAGARLLAGPLLAR